MDRGEAAERLQSGPLFQDVEPGARRALLGALVEARSQTGSVLLAQGHPNDHLSFLIDGSATIERARRDGTVETLATMHAPSVFGTTTFFTPDAPTYTVRAATEVSLLTLYHPAHDRLRREHPAAAEALAVLAVRVLSGRFNELDRAFTEYMRNHPDAPARIDEWAGFRARLFEEPPD